MLFINGCNPIANTHAFKWSGSTSSPFPLWDTLCGCEAFVLEAHTGKTKPSKMLVQTMKMAGTLKAVGYEGED